MIEKLKTLTIIALIIAIVGFNTFNEFTGDDTVTTESRAPVYDPDYMNQLFFYNGVSFVYAATEDPRWGGCVTDKDVADLAWKIYMEWVEENR